MCAHSPGSQRRPGLHPNILPLSPWPCESPPGALFCVPNITRTWNCWGKSSGGHEVDKGTGATLLQRLRKLEKVVRRRQSTFQYLKEPHGSWRGPIHQNCSDRTRSNGNKFEEGTFRWDIRKKSFTVKVVRHHNRLPRVLWMPGWTKPWATRSHGKCPCP